MQENTEGRLKKVKSILLTLPKPEAEKSPYYNLAKKYSLKIDFRPFIHVEGVSAKNFKKDKINFAGYSAVIFTSRNAVDHFFRICEEIRYEVPVGLKYFCNSESTALYLQKYIQYRKRKIFFDKRSSSCLIDLCLIDVMKKHIGEKFLYPCSDVATEDTINLLQKNGFDITPTVLFKTVASDLSDLREVFYDIIAFFSPSSIQSLYINFPDFQQNATRVATFGANTAKAVREKGLFVDIEAPNPQTPSMIMAIENYIKKSNK